MADVLSIPLPLPPLNEQRRIAAKIEVLQVRSAKAKEALEKAQSLLEQFRQSVLAAAFRGDLEHFAFETLRVSTHHSEKKRRYSQNPRRLCGGRLGLLAARAFSYFQ